MPIDGVAFTDLTATKKSRLQKSKVKTPLIAIAFFYNKGIIHKEFVATGHTIKSAFYQASFEPIATAYPAASSRISQDWILLHDSDPAHSTIRVRQLPWAARQVN